MALLTKCVPFLLLATFISANAKDLTVGKEKFSARQQMEDVVSPFRRLQAQMESPPEACLAACPTLAAAYQDIDSKAPNQAEGDNPDLESMGALIQSQCTHREALECMEANAASACSGITMGQEMMSMLECMCSACPCAPSAYGTMLGMMSSMAGGGDTNQAEMLDKVCPIVEPMECMAGSAACASIAAPMQGMASGIGQIKTACTTMNKPTSPAACGGSNQTAQTGSMMTCREVKDAWKKSGCCGQPLKTFTWPGDQTRRLSSDALTEAELLESVKVALRKAKLDGGEIKGKSRLWKRINSILNEYTQNAV